MSLTDAEISEIAARHEASDPDAKFWRDFARAIESAVLAKIATTPAASPIPIDARPLHPNHRPDLRYVRKVLDDVRTLALVEGDKLCGDVDAAVNGMDYIIKRTEEAASTTPEPSPLVAPKPLTKKQCPACNGEGLEDVSGYGDFASCDMCKGSGRATEGEA